MHVCYLKFIQFKKIFLYFFIFFNYCVTKKYAIINIVDWEKYLFFMERKKILIAEDEKSISRALKSKLIKEGFDVAVAYDGEEAIDVLKKEKIDLVLLDLIMPKINGFQVMEEIKNRHIVVPIIVTSNLSQPEDVEKARNLGAVTFIIKSNTSLAKIVATIEDVIRPSK
jgi:DNA-binding response OmpR family regulator